jgi:endonuclease YncB( thermonuclease family)
MGQREFPGTIYKVEDGDTVYVWCDQGFDNWRFTKVRLKGIATRPLSMTGGKEARDFLASLLPPRSFPREPTCIVYSYKWDKYAPRVDGDILMFNGRMVSELMIESGYAAPWDGKGKQPIPEWPLPPEVGPRGTYFLP